MTRALIALSASVSRLVDATAPLLCAIRLAPNRHITGLVCQGDMVVTTDQALPALDSYTVVLPNRALIAARPGARDPNANLATLRLDASWPVTNPEISTTSVGSLVIILGADAGASPTARLTIVHRFTRTAEGPAPVLDLPADSIDQGSLVLDADGRLIGLATIGPQGEPMAVPSALIGRMLMPGQTVRHAPQPSHRPGWLGVALQPIKVPDGMATLTGQTLGRMVVNITKGGPAALAAIRVGDVLLSLNGTSASGPQAFRAFLGSERVGTTVEVKLLRAGNVITTNLVVAAHPG